MKIHRFIGEFDLQPGYFLLNDPDAAHQIQTVLRLRLGEELVLGDGRGLEAPAKIIGFGGGVEIEIAEVRPNGREPQRVVQLYLGLPKRESLEWVVQKATEAGVRGVIPLITARTVKLEGKMDRLQRIAKEAAEQSDRGCLPEIQAAQAWPAAFALAENNDLNILCDPGGEPWREAADKISQARKVGVFIGPEGGFTAAEIALARARKFKILNLGKLTLRTETAAIIAVYLTVNG